MKNIHLVGAALAAFALTLGASAQNTIGVGVPTGQTRNDTYVGAGFEFYAPTAGTTINALGFWDANGTGLLTAHTVSIFKYDSSFNPSGYDLVATATIPAGTVAPLINGYRWVGIPTLNLPNNGQGGGYYAILATQSQDTWANSIGSAPYLNSAIGKVSGQGLMHANLPYTVTSSKALIYGDANTSDGFGGANLAYLTPSPATQAPAASIVWDVEGTFTDDTVLGVAGTPANEVYGVDFGGSGFETTANGYTFDDYGTTGNMVLFGNLSSYDSYLSGGGSSGDSSFDTVLTYGIYGGSDIYGVLQNLTVGQRYNVLAVEADTRGSTTSQFALTDELTISPSQTLSFPGGSPALGGYIEGTFTATTTNQVFTVYGAVQYNAILLEKAPPVTIALVTNTLPTSATAGSGSQITFTAAFSNSPAVHLQWQQIVAGTPNITNNINVGTVTVTNAGIISSSLTLTNLQVTNAGSYRLEAISTANSNNVAFSSPAPLTVIPQITWHTAGTYNGAFNDNSVLAFAGAVSNEVYGVDFGGSGYQTTANGYTFDDYGNTGNMTIASTIQGDYGGWLVGGATTGDYAFDTILTYGIYGSTANTGTLNNLTVGQTYTVLVLLDDTRGSAAGGTTFHITDGISVSPDQQYAFTNGVPAVGGYIIGTFTAEANTQPLTVENNNGNGYYNSQYNAILLEAGIAPAPAIAPMLTTDVAPAQSQVPVGAPMNFSVTVSGSTPIHYQWSNEHGTIAGATNASYRFSALAGTNAYFVSITNAVGGLVSSTAVVLGDTSAPPLISLDNTNWAINDNGFIIPAIDSGAIMLTDGNGGEASSTFYDMGQYIGGFVASFTYQTSGGADGITFCLQNSAEGTNAVGGAGGGLGYSGITPSAAFEMNIYSGAAHGGIGIRVGTNGSIGDFTDDGYNGTDPVNIASGDNIYVYLYYMNDVLQVLLEDPSAAATYATSFPINLPAAVGNSSAYIGFTGADGGITSAQTVSDFLFSSTTPAVLAIAPGVPGQTVVSWPVSVSSLYTLMQSDSVNGPWVPAVPLSSTVVGLKNEAALSAGGSASFYTLQLTEPNAP